MTKDACSIFSRVMIVSDFDGTLRDSHGEIPQRNVDAINRFTALGGTFIVASGRAGFVLDSAEPKVKDIVNAPCIYSNGSYFYDYATGKRSEERYMDEAVVRDIMYTAKNTDPNVGIRIVRGDEYLTPEANEEIKRQIERGYMENVVIYNYDDLPTDKINKITVCAEADSIARIKELVEERFHEYVDVFLSWKTLIDIQPKNVSKGSAIQRIRRLNSDAKAEKIIYCVGDYENDIDMLREADHSCCPSNSLQSVLDFCEVKLCSNDDGCIADLIDRIEKGLA